MNILRKSIVLATTFSFLFTGILVLVPDSVQALSFNTWTTDTDWRSGTNDSNIVMYDTGVPAYLTLKKADMPDWMKMDPTTIPARRDSYCWAWIDVDNSYLMFGGYGLGGMRNDTWKFNFTNDKWTQIFPSNAPSPRQYPGCAYDPVNQVVVLFGGLDGLGVWQTDTWLFDATTNQWTRVFPGGGNPRQLTYAPLTYDSTANKILTLARNPTTSALETWAYDTTANTWTNRNPSASPTYRDLYAIAYGENGDRTLLFAGGYDLTIICDYWEYTYSGNRWDYISDCIPNVDPYNRVNYAMTYKNSYGCIFMFGGKDEMGGYAPESWCYVIPAHLWIQLTITATPGGREGHRLADSPYDDATVLFGGYITGTGTLNDTWAFAKGFVQGVDAVWESSGTPPINAGCPNVLYNKIWFNQTSGGKPPMTVLRFQFATSTSPSGPWTYRGPGGFPGAHYTIEGTMIDPIHTNEQYFRVKAKLKTNNGRVAPMLQDVTITWSCPPAPPYIINTKPASGGTNHPINGPIWVNFSEPMNTGTVAWTISGGITATGSWSNSDQTLKLTPNQAFKDCTDYTTQITQGKDQNDNLDLVPGPVPNPWTFRTVCINPYITSTDPADGAIGVPLTKSIIVNFSEPMNTGTVAWQLTGPSAPALTDSWNGARTTLTLSHAVPFIDCQFYTMNITQGKDDQDLDLVPGPVPNPWKFMTFCQNPYIVSTNPVNDQIGVLLNAPIIVTFSEQMNTGTVQWWFSDPVINASFTPSWNSPTNTILTLSHSTLFTECIRYTAKITAGRDQGDNLPLVPGLVPNPWNFTAVCIAPYIVSTDPYDGETGVLITANIIVEFSEPIAAGSMTYTFSGPPLMQSWNPTRTILTFTHTTPFAFCTWYTVEITGARDDSGLPLEPGPVPNPWSFQTYCQLSPPRGLTVSRAPPSGVFIDWADVPGATSYNVYESQNRFAPFPSGWNLIGTPSVSQFSVTHLTDGLTHFYVVRAYDGIAESKNSTMGVKKTFTFTHQPINSNIQWFSLPYISSYTRASDIVAELGSTRIDVVGKWDPVNQRAVVYYYARGQWRGTDFTIGAGDGLYLSIRQSFQWNITGTDRNVSLNFIPNPAPKTNVFWTGIPYTGIYSKASDIANELTSSRIHEVGLWNPATQTSFRWYWDGSMWAGVDFTFEPGAGIYLIIISGFTWTPTLKTMYLP